MPLDPDDLAPLPAIDLSSTPTEELWDELKKRFSPVLLAFSQPEKKGDGWLYSIYSHGPLTSVLGLAVYAQHHCIESLDAPDNDCNPSENLDT